jgi:hypothetical protein
MEVGVTAELAVIGKALAAVCGHVRDGTPSDIPGSPGGVPGSPGGVPGSNAQKASIEALKSANEPGAGWGGRPAVGDLRYCGLAGATL